MTTWPETAPAPFGHPPLDLERTTLAGTDPDDAGPLYESRWSGRRFRVEPAPAAATDDVGAATGTAASTPWRYATLGDDRLCLHTSTLAGTIAGEVPWQRSYAVAWFREGGGTLAHRGGEVVTGAAPFLLPTELPWSFRWGPHRQHQVHLDGAFLEEVATEVHGGPPQFVAFDHAVAPAPEAVTRWRTTLSATTAALTDPDASPLLRVGAQLLVARAVLDLSPWTAREVPRSLRAAGPGKVRDAVDFVHEHADEPLTPADIARAAGLHVRTLQHGTAQHLGLSPMAYLRRVRLDHVRQELLRADRSTTSVADVARRWGFGNLGRFSAAYLHAFGEYPRTTLGR